MLISLAHSSPAGGAQSLCSWWVVGWFRPARPALVSHIVHRTSYIVHRTSYIVHRTGDEDVLVSLDKAKAIADAIPKAKVHASL